MRGSSNDPFQTHKGGSSASRTAPSALNVFRNPFFAPQSSPSHLTSRGHNRESKESAPSPAPSFSTVNMKCSISLSNFFHYSSWGRLLLCHSDPRQMGTQEGIRDPPPRRSGSVSSSLIHTSVTGAPFPALTFRRGSPFQRTTGFELQL